MPAAATGDHYVLRILTRCNVAGLKLRPGATLRVAPDKLRVVAHLVRCGTGRPADERTAVAVELYRLMNP